MTGDHGECEGQKGEADVPRDVEFATSSGYRQKYDDDKTGERQRNDNRITEQSKRAEFRRER